MIAKLLQPIKFENIKQVQMFIKPKKKQKKFSPNDLLIAADGNTFYLKDILDFSVENVGMDEEIKFLTRNGEKSYSPTEIKKFYNENCQLPPDLALHTKLADALNAIKFIQLVINDKKVKAIKKQLNRIDSVMRVFNSERCPRCPLLHGNIYFPMIDVTRGEIYETNLILPWINTKKHDPFGQEIKSIDFFKPDLALQSLLDTEFQYCQIPILKNIKNLQGLLKIEILELKMLEGKEQEYKEPIETNERNKNDRLKASSELWNKKIEAELRRNVFGFNTVLFILAAIAFLVTGILSAPLVVFTVAIAAFVVSWIVAAMFIFKHLENSDKAFHLSKDIERNSDYNRINHLLDQTPQIETYNSTIEKIQTRIAVKKDNIEKIVDIASAAGGHGIENNGENKSLTSNPTLSTKEQLEESGESSRLLNSR
jgi:hypothetical protein